MGFLSLAYDVEKPSDCYKHSPKQSLVIVIEQLNISIHGGLSTWRERVLLKSVQEDLLWIRKTRRRFGVTLLERLLQLTGQVGVW